MSSRETESLTSVFLKPTNFTVNFQFHNLAAFRHLPVFPNNIVVAKDRGSCAVETATTTIELCRVHVARFIL